MKTKGWTPEQHFAWRLENLKGAIHLADQCLKALLLLNGGAAAGLLTFYGNLVSREPLNSHVTHDGLASTLLDFGLGAACALGASFLAYISQRIVATTESNSWELVFAWLAVIAAAGSIILFVAGLLAGGMALP